MKPPLKGHIWYANLAKRLEKKSELQISKEWSKHLTQMPTSKPRHAQSLMNFLSLGD